MPYNLSLRELLDSGVVVAAHEAVAIVQQLIHIDPAELADEPPLGPASVDNVLLVPDGSVTCRGCAMTPSISEAGVLLDAMLPKGTGVAIPGALRYTVARAL